MKKNIVVFMLLLTSLFSCKFFNKEKEDNIDEFIMNDTTELVSSMVDDSLISVENLDIKTFEPDTTYYLVIGSFKNLENAQRLAEFYKGEIISSENGFYRVVLYQFKDKELAYKKVSYLRHVYGDSAAWLYKDIVE